MATLKRSSSSPQEVARALYAVRAQPLAAELAAACLDRMGQEVSGSQPSKVHEDLMMRLLQGNPAAAALRACKLLKEKRSLGPIDLLAIGIGSKNQRCPEVISMLTPDLLCKETTMEPAELAKNVADLLASAEPLDKTFAQREALLFAVHAQGPLPRSIARRIARRSYTLPNERLPQCASGRLPEGAPCTGYITPVHLCLADPDSENVESEVFRFRIDDTAKVVRDVRHRCVQQGDMCTRSETCCGVLTCRAGRCMSEVDAAHL